MITDGPDKQLSLLDVFKTLKPPEKITQEAFDRDDQHLRRLVRLSPGQRAEADDLWEYTQDLLYTEIQGALLAYLLPFCLEAWRDDLRSTGNSYGGFVEQFYPVLANCRVFDMHLTLKQTAAVSEFMRRAILDEIDDQRGLAYRGSGARPYRWVSALTTYGVLLPDVGRLWTAWWSLGKVGRAIAAVQYISCLMYGEMENPIFAPWTRDEGGGPLCLWEFAGHLYEHRWLEPNVSFLRETLSVRTVSDVLIRAVDQLVGQTEHAQAAGIQEDFALLESTLEARCSELPRLLSTKQSPALQLTWST
jgi:hypothetical protein